MNVCVRILFKPPTEQDRQALRSLADSLTSAPESVRVSAANAPGWLVAEFTMPTEAQYKAVPKIGRAIKLHAWNPWDARFGFPYTEAERAPRGSQGGAAQGSAADDVTEVLPVQESKVPVTH